MKTTLLKYRAYEIFRNRKYNGYQIILPSVVYKCFDKKKKKKRRRKTVLGVSVNAVVKELYKPVTKKIKIIKNTMQDLNTVFGQQNWVK